MCCSFSRAPSLRSARRSNIRQLSEIDVCASRTAMVTLSQDEGGERHPTGGHRTGNVRQLTDVPRVDGYQPHGMRSTDTDTLVVGGGTGRPAAAPSARLSVLREAALIGGLWLAYNVGRFLAARHTG